MGELISVSVDPETSLPADFVIETDSLPALREVMTELGITDGAVLGHGQHDRVSCGGATSYIEGNCVAVHVGSPANKTTTLREILDEVDTRTKDVPKTFVPKGLGT